MLIRRASTWFKGLTTWQKVAVVGGGFWAASLFIGGGVVVSKAVRGLVQNSSAWGGNQLGFGSSTIGRGGCLITALTMAVNAILGRSLSPADVNQIGRNVGAFAPNSSDVDPAQLARALGLKIGERIRGMPDDLGNMIRVVDEALLAGGLAVVHVDHEGDRDGDHFIVINAKTASGYTAVDPVNAKTIPLTAGLRGPSKWGGTTKNYVPMGAFSLLRAA